MGYDRKRWEPSPHATRIGASSGEAKQNKDIAMTLGTILLILLVLALIGVIPAWPHSRSWGYGPSGGIGLIVIILIVLLLMSKI